MTKDNKERDIISEIEQFISDSEAAYSEENSLMVSDLNFVYDEDGQWDKATLNKRKGRPSYTFNHVLGAVNQVIGEQRLFRPSIKIRGVDDKSDPELAEVYAGIIRNIESISNAESTYDMAFKYAVAGGFGAWRVVTEFQNDFSFDQEIFIKPIHNPFTVMFDPLSFDPVKRDQKACVIAERVSEDFYEAKYGGKPVDIGIRRDGNGWFSDKGVRIVEYFKMVPVKKEIAQLSDGRVVEVDDDFKKIQAELENVEGAATVTNTRTVETFNVKWWKVDGARILEGPITYDWQFIPVVKLPGRYINIEGKQKTQSLTRPARDPQMAYNYSRTTQSEVVANTPRSPWLVTASMVKDNLPAWQRSGSENRPFLQYTPDPAAPGAMPQRSPPPDVPVALVTLAQQDKDDIKAATGFHDASLGRPGNEISGQAIKGRARQADIGSYEFFDNLKKAVKFTGEILVNIIPTVYDTERTVRILGLDGQEDFVKINAYDEATDRTNDMRQGRYDVTVDTGPTFSTQREESFNTLLEAAAVMPIVSETGPDIIMKNLDVPGGDELVKRIRKRLIQQGTVEPNEEEQKELQEAQAAQGEPQPDLVQEALVRSENAKADKDTATAQETIVDTAIKVEESDVNLKQLKSNLITSTINGLTKT